MKYLLERKYGATVHAVASGPEAIEYVANNEAVNLIFLDIMMPEMNGIEIYQKLVDLNANSSIVMMSAFSESPQWREAQALPVPLLSKPIDEDELLMLMQNTEV